MNPQADQALKIKNRILRRSERIARWDKEAAEIERGWVGGDAYRTFCEEMAEAARTAKKELEAELEKLQA